MPGRCPTNRASLFPAGIIRNPGTEYTPSRRLSRPLKYPIHGGRHTVRQRCFYTRVDVDKVDWAWTCRGDDAKIVALRKQGIERTESICPWIVAAGNVCPCAESWFQRKGREAITGF